MSLQACISFFREDLELFNKIKSLVPERIKVAILSKMSPRSYPELEPWKGRKKVVIFLAGFYQNLGDMALTYAHKKFIEDTIPEYEVLLVPSNQTYSRMKALRRVVGEGDIITTIGGGNMDDLYASLENARRFVVRSFPNHPIISFPQTMAFSDTSMGRRALRRSRNTYKSHSRLVLFSREPRSLELMRSEFVESKSEMVPDIVLSLHVGAASQTRAGIMLTLRNDKESLLSPGDRAEVYNVVKAKMDDILVRDTVDIPLERCQPSSFESTLKEFWSLVGSRQLVVTDRLHGLIFCVITNTPVIVLPNSNHKIRESYEAWLVEHSYVRFLDSFDPAVLSEIVDEMMGLEPGQINGRDLSNCFDPLRRELKNATSRP